MSPRSSRSADLDAADPLAAFGSAARAWFGATFGAPTPVQARGWPAILRGDHALLCAPTGSGKTLAAFLAALDRLSRRTDDRAGVRTLYVSPLKALAYDVERNLRAPLAGLTRAATDDEPLRPVRIATRTGDTPARERRLLARDPSEILVTTPESLYLLLGSEARRVLSSVDTIIVDEIHALAPTKRGAHLALSLERLCRLIREAGGRDPQRIGLSATQRPLEEVARFLGGSRPVTIVDAGEKPRLDLTVEMPSDELEHPQEGGAWAALCTRVLALISTHRATIVFCNNRRLCERMAQQLDELWAAAGHAEVLVRAHHGSIARDQRAEIETQLKLGQLRGIVATSSLELGIDMGAVDLVLQIESPGAVSRGLQRVGRAGHHVGARSTARIFPKFRHDLLEATVVARRMLEGEVEAILVPKNALDVLSQQLVAFCFDQPRSVDELEALAHATYSYQTLSRELLVAVLDMLAGRYPANDLGELRPRVVWDRTTDLVTTRRDARMVSITNAGTIADRGAYGVYLDGGGPRVGELDEEMVHESRVGQTFLLGSSTWRITEITRDRVLVRPAPGEPGRMPFWRGEGPGRPIELGRAIGAFLREVEPLLTGDLSEATRLLQTRYPLDELAAAELARYLDAQRRATSHLPTDRTLVVERFRDELGDWRVCLHSTFGARVHAPLAMALEARLRERSGGEAQALSSDDGIVLRLGDTEAPPAIADLLPDPETLGTLLLDPLRRSSLFASHFRQNAARALLLPRRRPGQRTALWAQRLKAQNLLAIAGQFPRFPIVLETVRECYHDLFDLPALAELLTSIRSGAIRVVEIETPRPSPFGKALVFAYVAAYLYQGDAPGAERKAQALTLDRELLRELLGEVELRELLDVRILDEVEAELQALAPDRRVRHADAAHDLLRRIGDLDDAELQARSEVPIAELLEPLRRSGRVAALALGRPSVTRWVAIEDVARYRDAVGAQAPAGLPPVYLEVEPDALASLVARYARTHGPFRIEPLAARLGLSSAHVSSVVRPLLRAGDLVEGAFRPGDTGVELCDAEVLRRLRRQTIAALRRSIAPVEGAALARFLPRWHGIGSERGGIERTREALRALEGLALPFSELEGRLLPARVAGYRPRLLDELGAAGEIVWRGRGASGGDGRVAIYFRDHVDRLCDPEPAADATPLQASIATLLTERGAAFFAQIQAAHPATPIHELENAIWDLVWAGRITNDGFAPLRTQAHRRRAPTGRHAAGRTSPTVIGRWSVLGDLLRAPADETAAAYARTSTLLERHGVLTREALLGEDLVGGLSRIQPVLRAMEDAGRLRRGYFVEGLSGSQYALPDALERLRHAAQDDAPRAVALSAIDPANPYGVTLEWPLLPEGPDETPTRPRRVAGAIVVLVGARPLVFLDRGGRKLTLFPASPETPDSLPQAMEALRGLAGPLRLRVAEINGRPALRSRHATALERVGFRIEPNALVFDRVDARRD